MCKVLAWNQNRPSKTPNITYVNKNEMNKGLRTDPPVFLRSDNPGDLPFSSSSSFSSSENPEFEDDDENGDEDERRETALTKWQYPSGLTLPDPIGNSHNHIAPETVLQSIQDFLAPISHDLRQPHAAVHHHE